MDKLEIYERAWKRKGGDRLPKKQPIEKLDSFILLTERNRKQYVKLGNILWIIKVHYSKPYYDVLNVFPVLPRFKRGFWYLKDYPFQSEIMAIEVYKDENKNDWAKGYNEVIEFGIEQKNMYFNPDYYKTKYKFSETRLTK